MNNLHLKSKTNLHTNQHQDFKESRRKSYSRENYPRLAKRDTSGRENGIKITINQAKILIEALQHLIRCEDKRIRIIEDAQTTVIFGFYKMGDITPDAQEQSGFWLQAREEEDWLDKILEKWRYQKFFLEELLKHLQSVLRELKKRGGNHAFAD